MNWPYRMYLILCMASLWAQGHEFDPAFPTLQARGIDQDIELDGVLDEPVWDLADVGGNFTQREPVEGVPASEKTEVRILYTSTTLFIGIKAFDQNPSAIIAGEMERDGRLFRDDSVVVLLDTFLDRRNAYFFETNPNGARTDILMTDEGRDSNVNWDGVWKSKSKRTDFGWSAEMAIPFSTLKFNADQEVWGLNVRRRVRHKNEESYWSPILLDAGLFRVSRAGYLTGLKNISAGRALQVKPFATGGHSEFRGEDDDDADVGLDVSWGITRNLNLDLTLNTDFAETEADSRQVNLTRFSLFFPEKREFFLQNSGIFEFAANTSSSDTPLLNVFFSRRIGIAPGGVEAPIKWGAKLTGRVGGWDIGVLDAQTGDAGFGNRTVDESNWGVLRLRKNIGSRSGVGMIFTNRQGKNGDYNRVMGVDANIKPNENLNLTGFYTASRDSDPNQEDGAGGLSASWEGRLWDWTAGVTEIGEDFTPEMGFLLRRGVRRYSEYISYQPRPENSKIRNYNFDLGTDAFVDEDEQLESLRLNANLFGFRLQSEDEIHLYAQHDEERLDESFEIVPGIVIEAGDYSFTKAGIGGKTNDSRAVSAELWTWTGDFFDGTLFNVYAGLSLRPNRFLSSQTVWEFNDIKLPSGQFSTNIFREELNLKFTSDMLLSSFFQFIDLTETASLNMRFNWIYRPGADLFIVYNQTWDAPHLGFLKSADRQVILKFSYLWQR